MWGLCAIAAGAPHFELTPAAARHFRKVAMYCGKVLAVEGTRNAAARGNGEGATAERGDGVAGSCVAGDVGGDGGGSGVAGMYWAPPKGLGDPMQWMSAPACAGEVGGRGEGAGGSAVAGDGDGEFDGEDDREVEDNDDRDEPWGSSASIAQIIAWKKARYNDDRNGCASGSRR